MEKINNPIISIIVPSFNEEKRISHCLDGILAQTFTDFEVLCIDDNSTDSTFEIIEEYSSKDNRIIPLKNPKKGVSSARNFGIKKARGKFIGFVDSDDFIQPQMYEFLYRAIQENECDFSVCRYKKRFHQDVEYFDYVCRECKPDEFISLYDMDFVTNNELTLSCVWSKLIKKELIDSCEGFQKFKIGEDTVFCADLWVKTEKVFLVDLPLYHYFTNINSVCASEKWNEKWFDLIKTRFIAFEKFKPLKNSLVSSFYLERGMKLLLSFRFEIRNTPNKKRFKKEIKKYFRKYFIFYLKCSDISLKNKLFITVFFAFPFLYTAFRKMMDKTL